MTVVGPEPVSALTRFDAASSDLSGASLVPLFESAPDFALTSQDGGQVKLSSYRGKIMLVSFVFTTCNGTCPATTHRLALVIRCASRCRSSMASRALRR